MTTTDTSAEAVEQLAVDYDARVICLPDHVCKVQRADCCFCVLTAATLRALLAERDEFRRGVENAVEAIQHNHDEWLKMQAERDAAVAEAARMREALRLMIAAYALDGFRDRGLEVRAHEAAAAALGEPGHE